MRRTRSKQTVVSALLGVLLALLGLSPLLADMGSGPRPSAEQLGQWSDDLASDEFRTRQRAFEALAEAGEAAVPHVVDAVQDTDAEVRSRGLAILERWLETHDRSGVRSARQLLEERARSSDGNQSQRAAAALLRLQHAWTTHTIEELRHLGATVVRHSQNLPSGGTGYQIQIQKTWLGGNDRLELLAEIGAVRWLSIEHSPVGDRGLVHIGKLAELRNLYLGNSQITGEGLGHLAGLQGLQYLSLKQLPIDDGDLARLPAMPQLLALGLDSTRVSDAGLEELEKFPALEVLWLDHSKITDAGVPKLAALGNLKTLYLQGMSSPGEGMAALKKLADLKYLSLKGATLTNDSLKYIGQLDQLETLGLDHTNVADAQLERLAGLKKLRTLWLSKTKITDQSIEHLQQLPQLETLYLHGSEVTHDGANRLREKLPRVRVFR